MTGSFLALPHVVDTVTPLVEAPPSVEAFKRLSAAHEAIPADLVTRMQAIIHASAAAPGQWQAWFLACAVGALVFVGFIFTMKGRWSPAQARADEALHEAEVRRALTQAA